MLEAARDMMAGGRDVTIPRLAEETGVSRATIYRYFPSNDDLLVHAASPVGDDPLADADWPYSPHDAPTEVAERAAALVRILGHWAFDHEAQLRTLLRASLEPDSESRGWSRSGKTYRHRWIATLLAGLPDTVPAVSRERLAAALHALFGSDAVVWTTDMAGLKRDDAVDVLAWMARTLTEATLNESADGEAQ